MSGREGSPAGLSPFSKTTWFKFTPDELPGGQTVYVSVTFTAMTGSSLEVRGFFCLESMKQQHADLKS